MDKILVGLKRVVDYNVRVRVRSDGSGVETDGVKMSINPFDEIALEEALRIKESGDASEVVVVSIGTSDAQQQLRTGLAMGADRAILIETNDPMDPLTGARVFRTLIDKENPEMVILGKQAIDDDNNQTGQMLGALANMPQGTFASEVVIDGEKVNVTREVDGGMQTLSLTLPAIVTTDLRLNEPRYASLPNIMKAKKKPLDVIELADTGVDAAKRQTILNVSPPAERSAGIIVESVAALVDKLKNEAKVI